MKHLYLLLVICLFVSCHKTNVNHRSSKPAVDSLVFVPFNKVTIEEATYYINKFEDVIGQTLPDYKFKYDVLDTKSIPDSCLNNNKTRYRATKLLSFLKHEYGKNVTVIGITNRDISCTIHGFDDYGILGMSSSAKKVCINSTYRVKDKSQMGKLIFHEFLHTKGLFHCHNNDPRCYMKDAQGKGNLVIQEYLCESCMSKLKMK